MRIVQLNLAYDETLPGPGALLSRYTTLVEWSRATTQAGASVHVVQRFSRPARDERDGVTYEFVADVEGAMLGPWEVSAPALTAVRAAAPDVVHINGLMFPGTTRAIRRALPGATIVLQDHSGWRPTRIRPWAYGRWLGVFERVDAVTFTSQTLATRWHRIGLPINATVLEIVEASTTLRPIERQQARIATGMHAAVALLWVGRLNENKDPLTALAGMEQMFRTRGDGRCWMIYREAPLEAAVQQRIAQSDVLRDRVVLLGAVPHEDMPRYYSAADILIGASHHEGSGYALIEAMACGVSPVVTDIPAFGAIAGPCGARWTPGDTASCADALLRVAASDLVAAREHVRARFAAALSWDAIGTQTVAAYQTLIDRRRAMPAP